MEQLRIVPLESRHIRSYWESIGEVMAEGKYLSRTENRSYEDTAAYVQRALDDGSPFLAALDENERVVGWANAVRMEDRPHAGYLATGIVAEYRGIGLGKRLMQLLMEASRAFGDTEMVLDVRASNQRAINLYKSYGFALDEVVENGITVDGFTEDVWRMSCQFQGG